jgi:gas vesicle protein
MTVLLLQLLWSILEVVSFHLLFKNVVMKNVNKILLGAGIGIVAGSLLGFLLAPEKGSELRKRMSTGAKEKFMNLKQKMAKKSQEVSQEA